MKLLMPFDSNHPEFTRGFECGQLWAALGLRPSEHSVTLHSTNLEMTRRCAAHFGYVLEVTHLDSSWFSATFTPDDAPGAIKLVSDEAQ